MADNESKTINLAAPENLDDVTPVYCNHAGIQMTTWDVRFLFSEIVPTAKADGARVVLRSNIVMTPAHAKAFAAVLIDNIRKYEEQNGEIPWPPSGEKNKPAVKSARHQ